MASFSFNWIGENWFQKPPDPVTPINLLNFGQSLQQHKRLPNFASISSSFFGKSKTPQSRPKPEGMYKQMLEQFFLECEKDPDYRHTPEVEEILAREKGENLSNEEIEERNKMADELKQSPVAQFLLRAEEIADKINEMELEENAVPYRKEDRKLWEKLPHVIGPDGRPMPRKAIKTRKQSDDKFWDFARQFFFGLWGFRQRPYPPGRPIDVAQAIGYKQLEKRYYDFIMRSGGWYYKDRLGRTRGPLELITLKTAWAGGIIDTDTFIWGEDMDEWAPIGMVYGLQEAIATWEVRLGAAATAFIHKLQKGIPPWVPLKGHERKTYKQLQEEAIESKRRDLAVLEANDGVWPGVRIPSHALFLWASGPELTSILEKDHMPNKFIPKDLRKKLASAIPGLRPWEILNLEQAMDQITYGGEWYREPLGSYTTGPPYIRHWNRDVKKMFRTFYNLSYRVYNKLERAIPGFGSVIERVQSEAAERHARRKERREAESRAIIDAGFYDRRSSD